MFVEEELNVKISQVESAINLIDDGNTIPFIARYRKEATGGLSDEQLRDLGDRLTYLRTLEARKEEIINSIDSQGKLTDEIKIALANAMTLAEADDKTVALGVPAQLFNRLITGPIAVIIAFLFSFLV